MDSSARYTAKEVMKEFRVIKLPYMPASGKQYDLLFHATNLENRTTIELSWEELVLVRDTITAALKKEEN